MAEDCVEFKVISASSEDGTHVASNVAMQDLGEPWQTEEGEEKASLVLELVDPTILHAVEIGNLSLYAIPFSSLS